MDHRPTLIIVTGPTGSGKTDLSIKLARHLGCEIISADSRQLFRDIPIGTAAPTPEQLNAVKHHFVGTLSLNEYYSAARYEEDVLKLLDKLWQKNNKVIMCGGSMMYIDAVTKGIDELPTVSNQVRDHVMKLYQDEGIEGIRQILRNLDPEYLTSADPSNHRRLIHAIEICLESGVSYSSLRTGTVKERPFNIITMMIDYPREELFDRINRRVDEMIANGLEEEARKVYHLRHLNSLNTVGYKEMFAWFDGTMDRDTAIARIAKNTRVYAKKQLTWLKRNPDVIRLKPEAAYSAALSAISDIQ
ncbi:tRNA (adenosine(37)-N6)-dimethylallyltransferase MiaA [uncultured Muribaculum sp.]|uniref:tRNA (adenosine(37)-N6)-dimethylallyltransferase MiaA n=1 Tax=uncultured Muribaculum sp. TaxID=1918613 RepID=UPI00259A2D4B|nr:tRNA (adenosine(37)-N6)-dimethylallyltransferase MiaA [uncultured Muribaculum sp.]